MVALICCVIEVDRVAFRVVTLLYTFQVCVCLLLVCLNMNRQVHSY